MHDLTPQEVRTLRDMISGILHVDRLRIGTGRRGPIRIEMYFHPVDKGHFNTERETPAIVFDEDSDETRPSFKITHDGRTDAANVITADAARAVKEPLALEGNPPMTVESAATVLGLNANYVGGFDADFVTDRTKHTGEDPDISFAQRLAMVLT